MKAVVISAVALLSLLALWELLARKQIIYAKNLSIPVFCVILLVSLVLFSKTALDSALSGLKLWLQVVLPSLLPFFITAEILNATGIMGALGVLLEPVMRPLFNVPGCASFPLVMGVSSGYPVGAKITAGLWEKNLISRREAERLLAFTNNSGPLFIIGAVSTGMFNMPRLGLLLFLCHIGAGITVGIIFNIFSRKGTKAHGPGFTFRRNILKRFKEELSLQLKKDWSFSREFGKAVKNSAATVAAIGSYIIFFSVLISLLMETGLAESLCRMLHKYLKPFGIEQETLAAVLSGFFEITAGTRMAASALEAPLLQRLAAASFIIGWAGLSVHSQVVGIISGTGISIKPYLLGKLLHGTLSAVYTCAALKLAGSFLLEPLPAFARAFEAPAQSFQSILAYAAWCLAFSLICLIALALVSMVLYPVPAFIKKRRG